MAIGAETNVKWVDGLRGLASVLVVITHIYRQFDDPVFDAAQGENQPMRWDQWPFMSFAGRGRVGVTIFAFVTGYVCALKPVKLYRAGNQEAAFSSISKSAVRRFPRLMLPAAAATVVAWVLSELGLYTVLEHSDNYWLGGLAHKRIGTFTGAFYELGWQICKTWVRRENNYDNNQWTMLELLQESYKIYIFLFAVAYLKPRWRMASALLMMLYEWSTKEGTFDLALLPSHTGRILFQSPPPFHNANKNTQPSSNSSDSSVSSSPNSKSNPPPAPSSKRTASRATSSPRPSCSSVST